jgi:hypothetical protein
MDKVEQQSGLLILLPDGERAWLKTHEKKHTAVFSTISSPPGSTVRGQVEGVASEFQLKVRNCRKVGELFLIDGRTQNATRELNAILEKHG